LIQSFIISLVFEAEVMKDLSPPRIEMEALDPADRELQNDINALFNKKFAPFLKKNESVLVSAKIGENNAYIQAQIGDSQAAHVFEFFVRGQQNSDLGGGLEILIDYLDGVLMEFFEQDRSAFFPLDFTSRDFDGHQVWAKHEYHDFKAELLAAELLKKSS
jgi:hypothetical protein